MRFDWLKFCRTRNIPYETAGKNTTKGNITIHCPWCGAHDRSGHMGLSLDQRSPVWGCLRNAHHRGRDPARLVAKLLKVSFARAQVMIEAEGVVLDEFERAVDALRDGPDRPAPRQAQRELEPPPQFRPLAPGAYGDRFLDYLKGRGFGDKALLALVEDYPLWYSIAGEFAWRLIFPVTDRAGGLIGWTGREIRYGARVRYLTSEGLPPTAIYAPRSDATEPRVVVCEGPLDALKVDVYGREFGIRAIASMGAAVSPGKLSELRARIAGAPVTIVFDSDAVGPGMELSEELGGRWAALPGGVKDPGDLSEVQAATFLRKLAERPLHS